MQKERIELHCHTQFSIMDGVQSVKAILDFAAEQGMPAIAFTDHENIYAYPEIMNCVEGLPIRPIYGVEASVVDDVFHKTEIIEEIKKRPTFHVSVLIRNEEGRKSLYKLLTDANTIYFNEIPRIPLSHLLQNRKGLLIGSACPLGFLGQAIINNEPEERLDEIAHYFDYLEVQPLSANLWMIKSELFPNINSTDDITTYNNKIINLGENAGIPVVATSDAHYLRPEDKISRDIVLYADGGRRKQYDELLTIKTTTEMLDEFLYLGDKKAKEIVIENSYLIAGKIDEIRPIINVHQSCARKGDFARLKSLCDECIQKKFGSIDNMSLEARERLEAELANIDYFDTAHMYLYFHELIHKNNLLPTQYSLRGSAACMFVCFLLDISHINPLNEDVPLYTEFFTGIRGNRMPDIDMNFEPEVWPLIIESARFLPGIQGAYRASYYNRAYDECVEDWIEDYEDLMELSDEEKALAKKDINGILYCKELHPGGMILVPEGINPTEFSPLESIRDSEGIVFQFDYHSMDVNFEKIDLLCHENCLLNTRMYHATGVYPTIDEIKSNEIMDLLISSDGIGIKNGLNHGILSGVLGVPGLSNPYMINLIQILNPCSFSDIVKVEGICHGTGTWFDNGEELISAGASLKDLFATREDVYETMLSFGIEREKSFEIAESVRKGLFARGKMKEELVGELLSHDVPEHYIESCKKIKYLFPRSHAAEYAWMELCSLYYKKKYPEIYYKEYFEIYGKDFLSKIKEGYCSLESLSYEFKVEESASLRDMKNYLVWNEMRLRGIQI